MNISHTKIYRKFEFKFRGKKNNCLNFERKIYYKENILNCIIYFLNKKLIINKTILDLNKDI